MEISLIRLFENTSTLTTEGITYIFEPSTSFNAFSEEEWDENDCWDYELPEMEEYDNIEEDRFYGKGVMN